MSPFSRYLIELRRRHGLRQGELASLVGYEQSYLSALEIGLKGPPTSEFVERLIEAIPLSADDQVALESALKASQRKFSIPLKADETVFRLANRFWDRLQSLSPAQIRGIEALLSIEDACMTQRPSSPKFVTNKEARM